MKKILVVDDDKDIAKGVAAWLELHSFEVFLAHDGKAGITEARRIKPSLILLDVVLPLINGIDACRALKEDRETSHIPIIMLTSLSDIGDVEKAFQAGANDYISKPFQMDRLDAKIKKHLRQE
ncbi:MAG TPA: response regulator [bacterium]|nr:response regulator [bacterium]